MALLPVLRADDILFFGNSFTYYNDLPKMVETIATSQGKAATTMAITKGGQGWAYHLSKPATDVALKSKAWQWVILQDYSLNATHARRVDDFLETGQAFGERITQESPDAKIVLYETWAYSARHAVFAAAGGKPAAFASPDEMTGEIHKNYTDLQARLHVQASQRTVLVAPVGTAFARCLREHPEINLYAPDFKHPSPAGSYLAAAVIYATVFQASPVGAAPAQNVAPRDAKVLQEVAATTTAK